MAEPENLLTEWSRLLVGTLAQAGVTDFVVSPGSRNSPLTLALLELRDVECHSVLDERGAAFFALGLARRSGRVPVLVCTSGSALAHYLPALVEATQSELPLLVLSADRPHELQGASAPQTIEQRGVFAHHVKASLDTGEPRAEARSLHALRRLAVTALFRAESTPKGPVHLNFPARKPLEQVEAITPAQIALQADVKELASRAPELPTPRSLPNEAALERLGDLVATTPELLLSVGPVTGPIASLVKDLGEALGTFVLSEHPTYATPVEGIARGLRPIEGAALPHAAWILHVGPPPISSSWQAGLEEAPGKLAFLTENAYPDPSSRAELVLTGDVEHSLRALLARAKAAPALPERRRFLDAYERARGAICEAIERETALAECRGRSVPPGRPAPLPEPAVVARLLREVPEGANLCLGNSLPVRLAAWVSPVTGCRAREVYLQRGAAGIDGLVAGAAGVARAATEPTVLLIGDVSLAHDLSSLAIGRSLRTPLVVCLLDNGGGRIFDHLPLAKQMAHTPEFRFWTTPPSIDWMLAARAYGAASRAVDAMEDIGGAMESALRRPGITLLVFRVDAASTKSFLDTLGQRSKASVGLN